LLANIFLPLKNKIKTGAGSFSFEKMMQWTHHKAVFADAGHSYYKNEYAPFSIDQIRTHSCAFYIFHGLSPSPRAEYKFNPQRIDPVRLVPAHCDFLGTRGSHRGGAPIAQFLRIEMKNIHIIMTMGMYC
jgi:hypothetical protein